MTFFELVYACRLFGNDPEYDKVREALGRNPDFASASQQESLLTFLNKWGCRIKKGAFPSLIQNLRQWASNSLLLLPAADRDIRSLTGSEREQVAKSYDDALLNIGPRFKDTAIAKTLHAIRPRALPAWDSAIKNSFCASTNTTSQGTEGQAYAAFISHVADQVSILEADANRLGLSLAEIPQIVGHPDYSLVKLVDEYYWITITSGYTAPTRAELERWLRWI
jgi:hypothetical protein